MKVITKIMIERMGVAAAPAAASDDGVLVFDVEGEFL